MIRNAVKTVLIDGNSVPCIGTGEIERRIGCCIGVSGLKSLGFTPVIEESRMILWLEREFPAMCHALAADVSKRAHA